MLSGTHGVLAEYSRGTRRVLTGYLPPHVLVGVVEHLRNGAEVRGTLGRPAQGTHGVLTGYSQGTHGVLKGYFETLHLRRVRQRRYHAEATCRPPARSAGSDKWTGPGGRGQVAGACWFSGPLHETDRDERATVPARCGQQRAKAVPARCGQQRAKAVPAPN